MGPQFRIAFLTSLAALLVGCSQSPSGEADASHPPRANDKDGLKYVWIPPGKFTLGCSAGDRECWADEQPPTEITITKGFYLGQTEVTQAAFMRVLKNNPSGTKGDTLPVGAVHWNLADRYCRFIGGRLPTSAEWEYAARAGSNAPRYDDLDKIAWYGGNSGGNAHPVAQKEPNAFGLYDTVGNAIEWVSGWYGAYSLYDHTDPKGPDGEYREARGGGWWDSPRLVRVSYRTNADPNDADLNMGFRCAIQ
jgi:formylglycine-generating enzyme required for sulfatase activity